MPLPLPLPSLHSSSDRPWRVGRAACYGAGVGALAALFRILGPSHASLGVFGGGRIAGGIAEIAAAAFGFAVLFAAAAGLRNWLARQLG
jgi:hypothetical protein